MVNRILFLALCCAGCWLSLSGQEDYECYYSVRSDGLRLRTEGNYTDALNQFWAAKRACELPPDHDLDELIQATNQEQVQVLERLVRTAEAAQAEAERNAEKASQAEAEAIAALQQAETYGRIAEENGRRAEALRLAQTADLVRERGQLTRALLLAFMAQQIGDSTTLPTSRAALARAVRDSLGYELPGHGLISALDLVDGSPPLLAFADEQGCHAFALTQPARLLTETGDRKLLALSAQHMLTAGATSYQVRQHTFVPAGSRTLGQHLEPLTTGLYGPNGQHAYTAGRDDQVMAWSISATASAGQAFTGHQGNVYQLALSPDSQCIASRSSDGTVRLWSKTGQLLATLGTADAYLYDLCFSADGNTIYTASAHGWIDHWDLTGEHLGRLHQGGQPVVELLMLGERLYSRSLDDKIKVWGPGDNLLNELPHEATVQGMMAYGTDELLTWTADQRISLWSQTGELQRSWSSHRGGIIELSADPNAGLILSSSLDGTVRLWDEAGYELAAWTVGTGNRLGARLCPKGQLLILSKGGQDAIQVYPYPDQVAADIKEALAYWGPAVEALSKEYQVIYWPSANAGTKVGEE